MKSEIDLETALREALTREQPSTGFTERVMKRAGRPRNGNVRLWMAIAAMIALIAVVSTGVRWYSLRREEAARKAGRDLTIALKITGAKLHATARMVRRRANGV